MTNHETDRQAEALDAYLRGELSADHPDLPGTEAELAAVLKKRGSGNPTAGAI